MIIGVSGKINSGKDEVGKIIEYLTRDIKYVTYSYDEFNSEFGVMHRWKIKKFADKLKDIVCLLLNCTREELEDHDFKDKPLGLEWKYYIRPDNIGFGIYSSEMFEELYPNQKTWFEPCLLTPRKLLQLLGTDCGRKIIHPNIWCNSLMEEYRNKYEFYRGQNHMLILQGILTEEECMPDWVITDVRFPNEAKAVKEKNGLNIRIDRPIKRIEKLPIHESETALDNYKFDYKIYNDGSIADLIEKVRFILKSENILHGGK